MNDAVKESMSALMDGEGSELDLQRVLKAMADDPAVAAQWNRYHLTQAVLQDAGVAPVSERLAQSVAAAIAQSPQPRRAWTFGPGLARVALAASVALAVFLGLQTALRPGDSVSATVAQSSAPAPAVVAPTVAEPVTIGPRQVDPAARQRLEDYIKRVAIAPESPPATQLQQLQDSPLFRLVNDSQPAPARARP